MCKTLRCNELIERVEMRIEDIERKLTYSKELLRSISFVSFYIVICRMLKVLLTIIYITLAILCGPQPCLSGLWDLT